ncbi:MAG TPA: acylphosphatase [Tahibacter sp.]|uniref:acylphosphatase n=1 Tax=Tahibacter sp. TaxID=2056211 RepID=UPI002C7D8322|nr:acylphosphatase [Tahibacter sp.]HSX62702.1 acylphosphatase [Tahibacter sp.]
MPAARFYVSGRVQGVFFRASTRDEAMRLKLSGYATNLADGRVEVFAEGDGESLVTLEQWLRHGPPLARVEKLEREAAEAEGRQGFVTG